MTKYYFFKTVVVDGFKKLRALPGQTTYTDYYHQNDAVKTNYDVQLERNARTVQCAYGEGTLFIAKLEGGRVRDTRLLVHSRDGQEYYRLEGSSIYPVLPDRNMYADPSHQPSQDMLDAYWRFTNPDGAVMSSQPLFSTGRAAAGQDLSETDLLRLAKASYGEISAMGAFVSRNRDVHSTLLALSQLRDRMLVGVAHFFYVKQNGDMREAFGTRNPDIIGDNATQESGTQRNSDSTGEHFHYFDLTRHAWRCFCVSGFDRFDADYQANS